jgi:hypothetical protein
MLGRGEMERVEGGGLIRLILSGASKGDLPYSYLSATVTQFKRHEVTGVTPIKVTVSIKGDLILAS